MIDLSRGAFRARNAASAEDVARAQALRGLAFGKAGPDADGFDPLWDHILVEDRRDGALVACFRYLTLRAHAQLSESYAAGFYDLSPLARVSGPMVEMGRFCVHPERRDPDILRIAWGAMTRHVDAEGVALLFGCASFKGIDPAPYAPAFARLAQHHLAPERWRPGVRAGEVHAFSSLTFAAADARAAMQAMPPLLRTYLAMGGWVSDHAVVDREMNTLHVLTGVDIAAIPEARKRALRAVAG